MVSRCGTDNCSSPTFVVRLTYPALWGIRHLEEYCCPRSTECRYIQSTEVLDRSRFFTRQGEIKFPDAALTIALPRHLWWDSHTQSSGITRIRHCEEYCCLLSTTYCYPQSTEMLNRLRFLTRRREIGCPDAALTGALYWLFCDGILTLRPL